jgi:Ca2+-binding RTX toxin-like protein
VGERNQIEVRSTSEGVTVRERGDAALSAGAGCEQHGARRVTCASAVANPKLLNAVLGAGDDSMAIKGVPALEIFEYGGAGRDVLRGSPNGDFLQGSSGRDTLVGGRGNDVLLGDNVYKQAAGDDTLDGGRGRDMAQWVGRDDPVRVDLAAGVGGRRGEHDTLRSIEDATGGNGPDRLSGTRGPNKLLAGAGRDRVDGRGGADTLAPGLEDEVDHVSCGAEVDTVEDADGDVLPPDCEWLTSESQSKLDGRFVHVHPRARRGGVEVQALCVLVPSRCERRVTISSGGRVLGRSTTHSVRGFDRDWIFVPLDAPLPRGRTIEIAVGGSDEAGAVTVPYSFAWKVRE